MQRKERTHILLRNSLCDLEIIAKLYEASYAGVKIELIVRGICCLKTGLPKLSEHISVRSIVGNFLEHARIFCFANGGREEIYMGSADWMPRNLFPVEDENLKKKVRHVLEVQLADTAKAHILQSDGSYEKVGRRGKVMLNSQEQFCKEAIEEGKNINKEIPSRVFQPME